jgi:flavorubredoxin
MTFTPLAPTVLSAPELVGPETWVLHSVQEATGAPLFVYLNSMVIRGSEPIIIDTSTPANREQFLEDVFGIVEPEDVKWVFLSHDDVDHTGNLEIVMDRCPNATLVSSWAITERHSNAFNFPLDRCRWINDGESWSAGDRTFRAVRPPLYDSPTTRGLFDESTGVYWAVDSFACPMPGGIVESAADFEAEHWRNGMAMFMYHALSPWLSIVDQKKYEATVNASRSLGPTTLALAHSPVIREAQIDAAYDLITEMPSIAAPPCPDQSVLDAFLGLTSAEAPA